MTKELTADVIVAGAGSAGTYFAWQMGKAGYKVLVLEAKALKSLGAHIEIFHLDKVRCDEFAIPHPSGKELVHTEEVGISWSPDLKVKQAVRYPFYVLNMPLFLQRLHGYAKDAGVTILEEAQVEELLFEGGAAAGVAGKLKGEPFRAHARLLVDATGIAAALRRRMPAEQMENQPVPAQDCLYVCLEFRESIPPGFPTGSNSYIFHKAFWNKGYGDGVILGIGQPGSYDHAWELHRQWREEYFGDPGKALFRRQGVIPYHRPPFSLVAERFLVIGDAANQNKPFSGEGVTSGFTACKIAAEVAAQALQHGEASRAALWAYNVRYFRTQGAKFAAGLAQLPVAAELTRRDVNYLFRKGIIFSSQDFEAMNLNYEVRMSAARLAQVVLLLVWGALTGQFGWKSLGAFMAASTKAGKMKQHYLQYPENPHGLAAWQAQARQLWGE